MSFKYPHSTKYVYKNLNFKIPAGPKLAIVGINGAGKTTFVKLLSRLYEPSEGTIFINDIDIRRFNRKEYWKLFSVVFQEIKTFAFSVAENEIYERFNQMVGNKTAIYISHRLASTRFCDVIAFFENGCITEYGSHDQLMAQNGSYAEMFKIQAKYYQEDAKNLSSSGGNIMEETDSEFLKEAEQLAVCTTEGGEDIA